MTIAAAAEAVAHGSLETRLQEESWPDGELAVAPVPDLKFPPVTLGNTRHVSDAWVCR